VESKNNLLVFKVLSIIFFLITLTTSVSTQPIGDELVVNPGTFIIEASFMPDNIDPATNYDTSGLNEQVCETLVDFESNSTIVHPHPQRGEIT
jgi:hypothetical protein